MTEHEPTPEGLEYKDTRGAAIGYGPSQLPHPDRTGSALTDDERRRADEHGRLDGNGTGISEEDHKAAQFTAPSTGLTTDSGGTQSQSTLGSTQQGGKVTSPKSGAKS